MIQKKTVISTLTAIMITSQLIGCSSVSDEEIAQIGVNEVIVIETATPVWKELASLDTHEEFRIAFDDELGITAFGDHGKNGVVYVDLEGNHTNNSTFYYAMMNKQFRALLEDKDTHKKLSEAVGSVYTDDEEEDIKLAYINAYFNLLEDKESNRFNGNSSITRGEYLSLMYRAEKPVQYLLEDEAFINSVDPNRENEHSIYAQGMLEYSYLNLSEKSLNSSTFVGSITRGEAVYSLVRRFYGEEYDAVTGKEYSFVDAKNGGDIALKKKYINRETGEYKENWMASELQYALENPEKGLPEALYKGLVVAKEKGLLEGEESRWDESLTKREALELLYRVYESLDPVTNVERGKAEAGKEGIGEQVEREESLTRPVNKEDKAEVVETETSVSQEEATNLGDMVEKGEITQEEYDNFNKEMDDFLSSSKAEQIKWFYEHGDMTEEEYKELMDELKNGYSNKKENESIIVSEPTHVPGILPEGATYADPSKDGAPGSMGYDDVVLPEHLHGKWL